MKTRFQLFTFTLLLLIEVCPVLSQDISFNKVSLPDETLPGTIACITQDPEGNIWLGSQGEGLSRFDGLHLKSYKNDALNPSSIANNRAVGSVHIKKAIVLLICTEPTALCLKFDMLYNGLKPIATKCFEPMAL